MANLFPEIIGSSPAMQEVYQRTRLVAKLQPHKAKLRVSLSGTMSSCKSAAPGLRKVECSMIRVAAVIASNAPLRQFSRCRTTWAEAGFGNTAPGGIALLTSRELRRHSYCTRPQAVL